MSYPAQALRWPRISNILFATDFSRCSEVAAPYAQALAKLYGATVHLLHVLPEPMIGPLGAPVPDLEAEEQAAQAQLNKLTSTDEFKQVAFSPMIHRGEVADVILNSVSELGIDLIVVGTHGRPGLKHVFLGSIAEEVFRRANCPVLTVGPHVSDRRLGTGKIDVILYATDFSLASLHGLDFARSLAHANYARLVLFHAVPPETELTTDYMGKMLASSRRRLHNLVPEDPDSNCELIVACALPTDGILDMAKNKGADLIVMGAHRGGAASSHAPWAIAHHVVCHAECPVLTVRA